MSEVEVIPPCHECCQLCKKQCKEDWTPWSGCMPCTEYCENYVLDLDRWIQCWKCGSILKAEARKCDSCGACQICAEIEPEDLPEEIPPCYGHFMDNLNNPNCDICWCRSQCYQKWKRRKDK